MLVDRSYTTPYRLFLAAPLEEEAGNLPRGRSFALSFTCDKDRIDVRLASAEEDKAAALENRLLIDITDRNQALVVTPERLTRPAKIVLHWVQDFVSPRKTFYLTPAEYAAKQPNVSLWKQPEGGAEATTVLVEQYTQPKFVAPPHASHYVCSSGEKCLTELIHAVPFGAVSVTVNHTEQNFTCCMIDDFDPDTEYSWSCVIEELERGCRSYVLVKISSKVTGLLNHYTRAEKQTESTDLTASLVDAPWIRLAIHQLYAQPIHAYQRFRYKVSLEEVKAVFGLIPASRETKKRSALDHTGDLDDSASPAALQPWSRFEDANLIFQLPVSRPDFDSTILEP